MKKKIAALVLTILCGLNATAVVGCNDGNTAHTHDNKFYTVKQATCTEKGLMEVLCSTCGEKTYEEIQPVGHKMLNGVCTVCGYNGSLPDSGSDGSSDGDSNDSSGDSSGDSSDSSSDGDSNDSSGDSSDGDSNGSSGDSSGDSSDGDANDSSGDSSGSSSDGEPEQNPAEQPTDPTDFSAFYTFDDLYEKTGLLNLVVSEEDFYDELYNLNVTNTYVNSLGLLKVCANGIYYNLGAVQREYVPFFTPITENIRTLTIDSGKMQVVCANGNTLTVGKISKDAKYVDDKTKELLGKGYSWEYVTYALMNMSNFVIGITVNEDNQVFVRMGDNRIVSLGTLATNNTESNDSALVYQEKDGGYEIIGCMNNNTVESITIPITHLGRDIVGIGWYAFANCKNLKEVNIMSGGVTRITSGAFANCENLTKVTLPDTLTSLGDCVFQNCKNLTEITLPNSITQLGHSVFRGCEKLEKVTLSNQITAIFSNTFLDCRSLKTIEIPASVTYIGAGVFTGCDNLTSVVFADTDGWRITEKEFLATELANTAKAAVYLSETYSAYVWQKGE